MKLAIIAIVSAILAIVICPIVWETGGLYLYGYFQADDVVRIQDAILSSGNDDESMIFVASIVLLLSQLLFLVHRYLVAIGLLFSLLTLLSMESADFFHIAYATIFYGHNYVFLIWLFLYLTGLISSLINIKQKIPL